MKRIHTVLSQSPLEWCQGSIHDHASYELRCGTDCIAKLQFPEGIGTRLAGSRSIGRSADGAWEFVEAAGMSRCIEIRSVNTRDQVGVYSAATLQLRTGCAYRWQRQSASQWIFGGERPEVGVSFAQSYENVAQLFFRVARIEVAAGAAALPDLALLALVGGLLIVLNMRDLEQLSQIGGALLRSRGVDDDPDLEFDVD